MDQKKGWSEGSSGQVMEGCWLWNKIWGVNTKRKFNTYLDIDVVTIQFQSTPKSEQGESN